MEHDTKLNFIDEFSTEWRFDLVKFSCLLSEDIRNRLPTKWN